MTDRGEAYIMMEKTVAAKPQKSCLFFKSLKAKTETKATVVNIARMKKRRPNSFPFSFLGAYIRKINT